VLDDAVEYSLLDVNPARGKRRRMRVAKPRRSFLEPDMVVDLLDEAGAWERRLQPHHRYGRCAVLATLCLAGPRISELTNASRAQLDLRGGRLRVGEAKTDAGLRDLELTAFLLDEIKAHLEAIPSSRLGGSQGAAMPVFPTRTGRRLNASNIRKPAAQRDRRTSQQEASEEGPHADARESDAARATSHLRQPGVGRRARSAFG